MEFTDVELAGGAKLAAPVNKVVAGWPLQVAQGRVTPQPRRAGHAEHEMCAGGLRPGCDELHAGELRTGYGVLGSFRPGQYERGRWRRARERRWWRQA